MFLADCSVVLTGDHERHGMLHNHALLSSELKAAGLTMPCWVAVRHMTCDKRVVYVYLRPAELNDKNDKTHKYIKKEAISSLSAHAKTAFLFLTTRNGDILGITHETSKVRLCTIQPNELPTASFVMVSVAPKVVSGKPVVIDRVMADTARRGLEHYKCQFEDVISLRCMLNVSFPDGDENTSPRHPSSFELHVLSIRCASTGEHCYLAKPGAQTRIIIAFLGNKPHKNLNELPMRLFLTPLLISHPWTRILQKRDLTPLFLQWKVKLLHSMGKMMSMTKENIITWRKMILRPLHNPMTCFVCQKVQPPDFEMVLCQGCRCVSFCSIKCRDVACMERKFVQTAIYPHTVFSERVHTSDQCEWNKNEIAIIFQRTISHSAFFKSKHGNNESNESNVMEHESKGIISNFVRSNWMLRMDVPASIDRWFDCSQHTDKIVLPLPVPVWRGYAEFRTAETARLHKEKIFKKFPLLLAATKRPSHLPTFDYDLKTVDKFDLFDHWNSRNIPWASIIDILAHHETISDDNKVRLFTMALLYGYLIAFMDSVVYKNEIYFSISYTQHLLHVIPSMFYIVKERLCTKCNEVCNTIACEICLWTLTTEANTCVKCAPHTKITCVQFLMMSEFFAENLYFPHSHTTIIPSHILNEYATMENVLIKKYLQQTEKEQTEKEKRRNTAL